MLNYDVYKADNAYKQIKAIKSGMHKLPPEHQEIVDWIANQFQVRALDFKFDIKQTSAGYKQQLTTIFLETIGECDVINTEENRNLIISKTRALISNMSPGLRKADLTKCRTFLPDSNGNYPEMIVAFEALASFELENVYANLKTELETIQNQYPDEIWTISNNSGHYYTIFYFTDDQYKRNADGLSNAISDTLHAAILKFDEFNYLPDHKLSIRFDSKETFDRDYGSWHNYYQ